MKLKFWDNCDENYLTYVDVEDIEIDGEEIEKRVQRLVDEKTLELTQSLATANVRLVPRKIKVEQWIDTKCECGYCFSVSYEDGYYKVPYVNKTKYCPDCGQALLWED